VDCGQDFIALVDYAHTPDAVTRILSTVRGFTTGKVIAVLGCGGDRDATKRPLMGKALLDGADHAIFTSDNPRSEKPSAILADMTRGLQLHSDSKIIEDRKEAIVAAVRSAAAGDVVIILGKGHESGQEIAGVKHPFSDQKILAEVIAP
ncbi:MAG: UDP-N-acetylmuramoyl-L-alanyl-D-glutamate--2,6-diaminopimelate ligase, partial [Actinomycetales bacterium]|nr:UDP-N-acetylmuramoyl-L-alanyl-D-glutamate--2,6-diaminopimelate ligase [Actinomycetales bacterium]